MLINNFHPIGIPFKIGQDVNIKDTVNTPHNILDSICYHITNNYNYGSKVH